MKKIDYTAFKACTALETITLQAGIAKIDKRAFEGCTALKTIYVPAKKADYYQKRLHLYFAISPLLSKSFDEVIGTVES